MTTKTLRELIELKNNGVKFRFREVGDDMDLMDEETLCANGFHVAWILADFEYEEIKEPLKVEFECEWVQESDTSIRTVGKIKDKLIMFIGKKTEVTIEEIL